MGFTFKSVVAEQSVITKADCNKVDISVVELIFICDARYFLGGHISLS